MAHLAVGICVSAHILAGGRVVNLGVHDGCTMSLRENCGRNRSVSK